jgi:hypothetical protein
MPAVYGMEMRRLMIPVVYRDDNTEEPAQLGHPCALLTVIAKSVTGAMLLRKGGS